MASDTYSAEPHLSVNIARREGSLADVDVLRLGLAGDGGLEEAFNYYVQHILKRYGETRSYAGDAEVRRHESFISPKFL